MTEFDTDMFTLAIGLGVLLAIVGIGAYVLSDFASVTALIPAVFGTVIVLLGVVGQRTERQRLAAYGLGLFAVVAILGSTRGIPDVIALLTGGAVESPIAAIAQGVMILVGLVLLLSVVQYVRSQR